MLQIVDLNNTTHQVNNIKQITRSRKINGETSIDFEAWPDPKYLDAWQAVDNESKLMFLNEPFIIKDVTRGNVGETEVRKLAAEHTFFNNMINAQQYAIHNGSQTFQAALNRVFGPTIYNFVIVGSFTAQTFDNFGRENCLSLFQKVLERYGAEFRVSGNTVYLYHQIGAHTGFQWRYKHNIKSITEEKSTRSLTTVIKGYFGKPDDNGVYPMEIEHRSTPEKIAKFGELHAESYTNENVTDETTALRLLDERLNDEPVLSQTIDFADLQAAGYDQGRPNEGDWGYIIYEPMDIRVEARIVEVNEVFELIDNEWTPIKTTVTLSNIRQTQTDKNTRFAKTSKQVDRLASGVDSMPLSSMDIAVKNMTRLMQNASTEIDFPDSGGMRLISRLDSNRMLIGESEGWFFSRDGGATPYAGFTADGVVTEALTAGTIDANLIRVANERVVLDSSGIGVYSAGRLGAKLNDGALNFFDLVTGESIGRFSSSVLGDSPTTKGISMNLMNNKYMSFGYYKNVEEGFRPAMSINMSGMNSASIGAEGLNVFTDATFHGSNIRSYSDIWMGPKALRFGTDQRHNHASIYKSSLEDLILTCYNKIGLAHTTSGGVTSTKLSVSSNTVDIWQDLDMHGWKIINSPTIIDLIDRVKALENA